MTKGVREFEGARYVKDDTHATLAGTYPQIGSGLVNPRR